MKGVYSIWFDANEQGLFQPFPIAIDVGEAEVTQPSQLGFDIEELIGWVFRLQGVTDRVEVALVEFGVGRGDMFEVTEDPCWLQTGKNLSIKGVLALMGTMVDGETGHNRIEATKVG